MKALDDVSFSIEQGEVVLIVGSSGSGKSTLLNMIGLLDSPTNGNILIDEINTTTLNDDQISSFRNKKLGFIFQGMLIGAIGAGVGTATGLGYTFYAKETKMSFNNSLPLEVTYNWEKIIQTALASFVLAIIASLYPSYRATKLLPVEAMRTV